MRLWLVLLALLALAAVQVPGAGVHALTCLVYVAASAMVGLPLRQAVPFAAALLVLAEVLAWRVPGWDDQGYGLAVLLGSAASGGIRLAADRQRRLQAAQRELADMAQRELAGGGRGAGPDRRGSARHPGAFADGGDGEGGAGAAAAGRGSGAGRGRSCGIWRALARDALSDVRATALGVRGISLPGEIAAAREALAAAHVRAELPGATDAVPTRNRELFAWTIREAVTNVVRHSRAGRCEVRLGPGRVEIVDDGPGDGAPGADGQGLLGLRRRAEAAGGALTVGPAWGRAGFPGTGGGAVMIRLLLADDQALVRGAMAALLDMEPDLTGGGGGRPR